MIAEPELLSGRYRLEELLGAGGMARVYLATDQVLDRRVAVKVLASRLAADPRFLERFGREARAAASLSHPGVVAVYDTGTEGDLHYIVMEYVEGNTLATLLEQGPLPPDRALGIGAGVCTGLAAAHERGLVHRDVKPGNIMMTTAGAVKVMDFGIARPVAGAATEGSQVMGTAAYLSPEQARGAPVDHRSDLYSLGAVIFEMLTGRPPFTGETPVAIAQKHAGEPPPPPSSVNPALDPDVDAVVLRALAKPPDERYGSAEELRGDLERLRRGEEPLAAGAAPAWMPAAAPTEASSTMALEDAPPPEPPRRRRAWLWAIPVMLLLAGLAALGLVLAAPGDQRAAERSREESPPAAESPAPEATEAPPETEPPEREEPEAQEPEPQEPEPDEEGAGEPDPEAVLPGGGAIREIPPISGEVADRLAELEEAVVGGMDAGEVSDVAAEEIGRTLLRALRDYQRHGPERASERLERLEDRVESLEERGEITSEERAEDIQDALEGVREAVEPSNG